MVSEYFGGLRFSLTKKEERMKFSNNKIKDYIATLGTPEIMNKNNQRMTVVVYFDLNTFEIAENISIKKSSGNKILDNIVLEYFKKIPNWQSAIVNDIAFG